MTLRARLALGLVAIAVVLLVPVAITLNALNRLNQQTQALRLGEFQASLMLGRVRESVQGVLTAENALLFVSDSSSQAAYARSVAGLQARTDSLDLFALDSSVARLKAAVAEVAIAVPELMAAVRAGNDNLADTISAQRTGAALRRADGGIILAERSLLMRTQERVARVSEATQRATGLAATSLALALIAAAGLATWLLSSIARPVRELERGMEAIADGDFDHKLPIDRNRHDEFGRLAMGYAEMVGRLRELNKLKAEFISVASHELKTPVNVMIGYLQLLQEGVYGDLSPKQREILKTVESQGHALGRLTKHLLDMSRFEAGGSHIEPRPMRLGGFLDELERAFHVLAMQREVRFLVTMQDGLPDEVTWDADRMNEVVGNLLANAFKFTPRGGAVELRAEPHDDDGVLLTVQDTGAGIPPDQVPRVFQKFYQADNQRAAAQEGTGLGLAIAKEIVEAHRGAIRVESTVGVGTTFQLVLPREVRRRSHTHMITPAGVA